MSAVPSVADLLGQDVARIYEAKGKLTAAASAAASSGDAAGAMAAEQPTYQTILASVKGSEQVKQLAADYIPQFLHYFPTLVETGINAQLDLVEDEKASIRLHAIRGLELICKHNPSTVRRIAEVLGQLLVSEDKLELLNTRTKGLEFLQQQLKALLPAVRKDEAAAAGVAAGLKGLLSGSANALIGREELKFFVQTLLSLSPHHANAAKIRTDEPLKAELAAIALAQSGLHPSGALDLTNEAAIKHFLSVQSVVNNLASVYGVDTAPFLTVYFKQILPNLEQVSNVELRSQLLRAVANNVGAQSQGANKLAPKQAQALFPAFYALFKKHVPLGEVKAAAPAAAAAADGAASAAAPAAAASGAQPEINFATAEVFLYLFHLLAAQAPSELRAATGIFTPTGQPGEFAALNSPQREEFNTRIAYLLQSNAAYKETLHAVQKRLQEELKEFNKQNQQQSKEKAAAAKAAKKAGAAPAVAAGQPAAAAAAAAGEKKEEAEMSDAAASAAADASAVNTAEDKSSVVADLRSKLASINAAIRISASVAQLAKPLQDKPLPTLLTAEKMSLSWRENRAPSAAAGGAAAAAGGKQQQQQKKGGQQQQQQAKQAQKGQKRKSDGGGQQQQSQSHKKQQQQSGSQKKGGNQQQQQQQQNKRQKQQPNGGGQSQSNKGGQRRRR